MTGPFAEILLLDYKKCYYVVLYGQIKSPIFLVIGHLKINPPAFDFSKSSLPVTRYNRFSVNSLTWIFGDRVVILSI